MSEINIIILIVLEKQYFLNIGILYNFSIVKNKTHNKINYSHIIIIQYSLSIVLISSLIAFTSLIIAKVATNVHIFSPLNISFYYYKHYNYRNCSQYKYKNIECQVIKNRSSYEAIISFSLSKVLCCLSKDIFFCLYLSTNSLNVYGADNNSSSKSSDSNDIGKTCSCFVILWKKGISKVLINSSK